MNSNALRSLAIAVLVLLVAVSYASAQTLSPSTSGPSGLNPTSCNAASVGGGNGCPSPQYRYGAAGTATTGYIPNAGLTGNPIGDKNVLNSTTVIQLVPLPNTPIGAAGGCQSSTNPTSSPSIESRIIFPALFYDVSSGSTYCALFTYDLLNPSIAQYMPPLSQAVSGLRLLPATTETLS
jgi:hypothetical protein